MNRIIKDRQNLIFVFAFGLALVVNFFSWDKPFFWDSLLTSSITQYYFEHGFGNLILPNDLDAGHPPFFYIYIVVFYKLFGLNLFAAHLSMLLPSLLGLFSLVKILQHLNFSYKLQAFTILGYFFIPAILTQHTLVSYDLMLSSLYLFGIYCILFERKILLSIIAICICSVAARGLFFMLSLFFIYYLYNRNLKKSILIFLPALLLFGIWMIYHTLFTQHFITLENNWSEHRKLVNLRGLTMNLIALARVLFDFGIVLLFIIQIFQFYITKKISRLQLFWIIPFIVFAGGFVFLSNPIGHRYFLVVYIFLLISSIYFLNKQYKKWLWILCLLPLGHFQIYGNRISNGWDCTLEYLSFISLKNDFDKYIKSANIDNLNLGTVFPMNLSERQYYLSGDSRSMVNIHGKNIDDYSFILYSNIGNDFSNNQLDRMQQYQIVKSEKRGRVTMILYYTK